MVLLSIYDINVYIHDFRNEKSKNELYLCKANLKKIEWSLKNKFMLQMTLLSICAGIGKLSSCQGVCAVLLIVLLIQVSKAIKDLDETCQESKMRSHIQCKLHNVFMAKK